jgi:hypothetical protein
MAERDDGAREVRLWASRIRVVPVVEFILRAFHSHERRDEPSWNPRPSVGSISCDDEQGMSLRDKR